MTRKIATSIIVLGLLLIPQLQAADEPRAGKPVIKQVPLPKDCLRTMDGEFLYQQLCVSCHGVSGHGNGLAVVVLNERLPDLTYLAARNGGEFPAVRVIEAIQGKYHETLDESTMPRWGRILGGGHNKEAFARLRVYNLAQHVKSLQLAEIEDR